MNEGAKLILGALLGWLLGLLTPQIVDFVRRRYERGRIAAAITSELQEISERLSAGAYYIWNRHGLLSIAGLQWVANMLERAQYHPRHRRIAVNLRGMIANGPEKLRELNVRNAAERERRGTRVNVRRIETPYLTSVLPRLDVFPAGTRQALLSIDAQFKIYNEIVEECREYARLTFNPAITGQNRVAVLGNVTQAERAVAERAHYIVTLISI